MISTKTQLRVRSIPSHLGSGWFQLRLTPWRQVRAEFPISVYPGKHSNEMVWPTVKSLPITKPFRNGRGSGQLCNWYAEKGKIKTFFLSEYQKDHRWVLFATCKIDAVLLVVGCK